MQAVLEVKLRFLQLQARFEESSATNSPLPNGWQEAVERQVSLPARTIEQLLGEMQRHTFSFAAETEVEDESRVRQSRRTSATCNRWMPGRSRAQSVRPDVGSSVRILGA